MNTTRTMIRLTGLCLSLLALASCSDPQANGLELRNTSLSEIRDIKITITSLQGDWTLAETVDILAAGESVRLSHDQNDTKAVIEYTLDGVSYTHTDAYVDLWTGQTWLVSIPGAGESSSTWR